MKILMVTNNYTPYSGGVVSSINATVALLQQAGHDVRIVTLDFGTHEQDPKYVHRLYCPLQGRYYNRIACAWRPFKQLSEVVAHYKPDLIHSHHPFFIGVSAQKVAKQYKIPLVFTHHTLYEHYTHYVPFPPFMVKPIINYLVTQYCKNVDGIVAPSQYVKQKLVAQNIEKPIEVIPSALLPHFSLKTFLPKLSLKSRKVTLLTVSRFAPEKNLTFLLDVAALLPQDKFQLLFVGFGVWEDYLKRYAYTIKKLPHFFVKFIIKPSKQELVELYKQADIFIFASQAETQGLVVSEALACGTPVIALNGPGVNEVVKNGINGFLVHSKQEMTQKIYWLSENEEVWELMQQNAFESVKSFQKPDDSLGLIDFYEKIKINY